jgi:hypothetical protein
LNLVRAFDEKDVQALEGAFLERPQVECGVRHHFGPGIYIREVTLPADSYIIGHSHKEPHMCVMLTGRMTLIGMDGTRKEISAPASFVGKPGRKIAHVHEEVVFQNIWATDETDVETLEQMYLDTSPIFESFKADYIRAIESHGISPEQAELITQDESDRIPMPHGSYKFQIGISPIHGKGTFATSRIEEDETIGPARIDGKRTDLGRYVNHSPFPNAAMVKDGDMVYLVATKPIAGCKGGMVGDEITVDYGKVIEACRQ